MQNISTKELSATLYKAANYGVFRTGRNNGLRVNLDEQLYFLVIRGKTPLPSVESY